MSSTQHAFDFLEDASHHQSAGTYVVFGDEAFLKRQVLSQLKQSLLGAEQDDVPIAVFDGASVQWRDVIDELATVSLFGGDGPRIALVEQADPFVSQYRGKLEDHVAQPSCRGVLILEVNQWASNTRLFKQVNQHGCQVECRAPQTTRGRSKVTDEKRIRGWLSQWAEQCHQIKLPADAAEALLSLVGIEFGLLDQNLAKLALYIECGDEVTVDLVHDVVGGWRSKTIWDAVDAAADGDADEALRQLDRLLQSGEHPQALFGQISWSFRRYAAATDIYTNARRRGTSLGIQQALKEAGFRPWPANAMADAERRLKQLGRQRGGSLYRWLLETDLALKGSHSQPPRARLALETLFLRMARELGPQSAASSR